MFLMGPITQMKNMFANKRIIATGIYLTMMVVTLVVAIKAKSIIGSLFCIVLQFMAFM